MAKIPSVLHISNMKLTVANKNYHGCFVFLQPDDINYPVQKQKICSKIELITCSFPDGVKLTTYKSA